MAEVLRTGSPIHGAEGIVERPDGSKVWAAVYIDPIKAADGQLLGAINCFNEITALRKKEEELANDLRATRMLQEAGALLLDERGAARLYEKIVETAVAVLGCECASLQRLTFERDPAGELQLLANVGFASDAAKRWERVSATDGLPCSIALRSQQRVVVADVGQAELGPSRDAFLAAGIHAVQSTPLLSRAGSLLGTLSTHWHRPHNPTQTNLLHIDLLARLAADAIERTRAEDAYADLSSAAERQKRLYEAILTNTPDFAYVFDLQHRFIYANEGLLRMWGKSQSEAIGKTCLELGYEPWHAEMHNGEIDEVVATKKAIRGEVPFTGTFGKRIYDYIFVPVFGPDGNVEAVAGTTRDVTETREGIKQLSQLKDNVSAQLADMRQLHDFSRRVMLEEDPREVLRHVLSEALALLRTEKGSVQLANAEKGLTLVGAVGFDENFSSRFANVDVDGYTTCAAALKLRERVLVEDLSKASEFSELAQLAATYGVQAAHSTPLLDRHGKVIAMLTAYFSTPYLPSERELRLMDLYLELAARHLERKQAEASLRESENRFRAFVTTSSDMMYRMSPDWSEMWQMYGKEFISTTAGPTRGWLDTYVHPEDKIDVMNAVRVAIEARSAFELEHRVFGPDASLRWVHSRAIPLRDADGEITEWFGAATDVTTRKRHEEHQRLLLNELNHRVKNTLATVQSMASQTLRNTNDTTLARRQIDGRLIALSKAHDVLTRENWEGASLRQVVLDAVAPYRGTEGTRFTIVGPDVKLSPKSALALAMALHELCTNAVKYGALSNEAGLVSITWTMSGANGSGELKFTWAESSGPIVTRPSRRGFGSRLIEQGLKQDLAGDVHIEYEPSGVRCSIRAPIGATVNDSSFEQIARSRLGTSP